MIPSAVSGLAPDPATGGTNRVSGRGCYGLRLEGVDAAARLLVDAPEGAAALALEQAPDDGAPPDGDRIDAERAHLRLQTGGWVEVVRSPARAIYRLPAAHPPGNLVHPYLAPVAAILAHWAGLEAFHAGAVVTDGGALAVVGDKGAGKSSLLGWLAMRGHPVLADDLIVIDDGDVLAGPRCVDLRADAAERLGAGERLGVVGQRERWRLGIGDAPWRVPLRGWILLGWGDAHETRAVRGPDRLLTLLPHRTLQITSSAPAALMRAAALPAVRLLRPRSWDALPEAGERLLGAIPG